MENEPENWKRTRRKCDTPGCDGVIEINDQKKLGWFHERCSKNCGYYLCGDYTWHFLPGGLEEFQKRKKKTEIR